MAYTKYSLTPSSNTAAPPDGAPEGMLPSAVNDTMRDMMAQIRDCGDGIRGGTYTLTAPVVTGGSINGATVGATTASMGAFTTASLKGSTSGVITLDAPAVAGTNTATLPAATGTVMVSGNMPAFSAYSTASQNPTSGVATKVIFGAEYYDTNNNFASSTFTPTVAGYYQLSASISMAADTSLTAAKIYIYKNGSGINIPMTEATGLATAGYYTVSVSALVQANGSTDYFEIYGTVDGIGVLRYFFSSDPGHATAFTGVLVRSA